jgi:hypothetical protein
LSFIDRAYEGRVMAPMCVLGAFEIVVAKQQAAPIGSRLTF